MVTLNHFVLLLEFVHNRMSSIKLLSEEVVGFLSGHSWKKSECWWKKSGPENTPLIEEYGDDRTGSLPILSFPFRNCTVVVDST